MVTPQITNQLDFLDRLNSTRNQIQSKLIVLMIDGVFLELINWPSCTSNDSSNKRSSFFADRTRENVLITYFFVFGVVLTGGWDFGGVVLSWRISENISLICFNKSMLL